MGIDVVDGVGDALWLLSGTVGLVLLIACANVANLPIVRAEARQTEIAIRAALEAGRWRLVGGSLVETAWLAAFGGLAGLGLARAGVTLLLNLRPEGLPRIDEIGFDGRVAAFAGAASCSRLPWRRC